MDENKEFLNEETEAAAAPEAAEEAIDTAAEVQETALEETGQSVTDDAAQLFDDAAQSVTDDAAQPAAEEAPKKKRALHFPILLSLVIVLALLAVGIACRMFFFRGVVNTDPFGNKKSTTWHYRPSAEDAAAASVDEAEIPDYYFIFEPDGTIKVESGSIEFQGNYTLRNAGEDDVKEAQTNSAETGNTESGSTAQVGLPILVVEGTNQIDGKFLYQRDGNAFTANNLTLSVLGNDAISLTFDDKNYTPPKFEREGEFTKDENLLGSWSYKDETMVQTFVFQDDGTYELKTKQNNNSVERQYGIYNCKDGTLTLSYCYPTQKEQPLKYSISDNKLSLIQVFEYLGQTMEQPLKDFTRDQ